MPTSGVHSVSHTIVVEVIPTRDQHLWDRSQAALIMSVIDLIIVFLSLLTLCFRGMLDLPLI